MDRDSIRWTASELAEYARKESLLPGGNPERTVKYYKSLGLLKPTIVQEGSVRRAYYSPDHLVTLRMIRNRLRHGMTLAEIKVELEKRLYLSAVGRAFIEGFRGAYPDDAFLPGMPLTRAETAFLLTRAIESMTPEKVLSFLWEAVVDESGNPVVEDNSVLAPIWQESEGPTTE